MTTPSPTPELKEETQTRQVPKEPSMYLVQIINDDYTPYGFVVGLLSGVFHHSTRQAEIIATQAHEMGRATVGRYSLEVAETKVDIAERISRSEGFPLTFEIIPEPSPRPSSPGP